MTDELIRTVAIITDPLVIGGLLFVALVLTLLGSVGVKTRAQWVEPLRFIPMICGGMAGAIAAINIYIALSTVEPHAYRFAESCIVEAMGEVKGRTTYGDLGRASRSCGV